MVGTSAGDMVGEVALAIVMVADAVDIGKTVHLCRDCAWQLRGCAAGEEVKALLR
jgi:hypothetical protein